MKKKKEKTRSDDNDSDSDNGLLFRRRLRYKQTMFEIVAACYETLVDVESRRKYDQHLKKQEMEHRENQRRLHLLQQLVGSTTTTRTTKSPSPPRPTTRTRTRTPRTSTGRNVNPKKRNDVVRVLLPSSSSSSPHKMKMNAKKKTKKELSRNRHHSDIRSGSKNSSTTTRNSHSHRQNHRLLHGEQTRTLKIPATAKEGTLNTSVGKFDSSTLKEKTIDPKMMMMMMEKKKKKKKTRPHHHHHHRTKSKLSSAATSALIEYEDGQGVYTTDREFKQKIMMMDNNKNNHNNRQSHNNVKSKNNLSSDDNPATATAPEGSSTVTGTASSVSSSSSVCGDSSSSSSSGDNRSNRCSSGCIDDEQQQRQSNNSYMLDRFTTEANTSCYVVGDMETTTTTTTTSGGGNGDEQQQKQQRGLQDFEISQKDSTTDEHRHIRRYELHKNGNEPPCLTRSSSCSSDCSSFHSTSTVEITVEEEEDARIKLTNTSTMTTKQADDEVLPPTVDLCSGMNIGLLSCFHPTIESSDRSTSELLPVKEDGKQSPRHGTMVSTRGGRGREGMPSIALSNSFSSSSSEFSSSSFNNRHFSEVVVNQLFGGPLAPLHRARNFVPFTDPYIIFERVFGRSIFPRVKHSMNSNINDRHKIQQQSLSVQHETRKNHRAVAISRGATEYQKTKTKTSTKPSTGVIHEISRMVGDRIITRTATIETNPLTGRKSLSVVVNTTELATDSNDDLNGNVYHCDSLSAIFSSIQYVVSQFQW